MLLRLAREHDVLLESFRPGVMDRLGVGYERLREENPRLVYCAITGYGQDGPYTGPLGPRHELPRPQRVLGLTGEAGGPPVQPGGQIADLGGGALMAAFGIMAALRERERSGEGQLVDVSMFDGSLSWLALVAAKYLADGAGAGRGEPELPGGLICYRPYACRTAGSRWARSSRSSGRRGAAASAARTWWRGSSSGPARRPTPRSSGLPRAHARGVAGVRPEHDCCLEPVLDLDEALDSELVRAREMVSARAAGRARRAATRRAGEALAHARSSGRAGPGARRAHAEVLASLGYSGEEIGALLESGAPPGRRAAAGLVSG